MTLIPGSVSNSNSRPFDPKWFLLNGLAGFLSLATNGMHRHPADKVASETAVDAYIASIILGFSNWESSSSSMVVGHSLTCRGRLLPLHIRRRLRRGNYTDTGTNERTNEDGQKQQSRLLGTPTRGVVNTRCP